MRGQQKSSQQRGRSKLYTYTKQITSILITLIILIPIVFILGSEQTQYHHQELYSHSSTLLSYSAKTEEIQQLLKKQSIVNVYYDDAQTKEGQDDASQWQNIRQFSQYLGYSLNSKGNLTISRVIHPLQNKLPKNKNKNNQDKILVEKSYEFTYFGEVNMLKNKLKAVLLKILKNIKTKQQSFKQSNLISKTYLRSVRYLNKNNIWFLIIDPNLIEHYQSSLLIKQIKKTLKSSQSQSDKFIIFSKREDKELSNVKLTLTTQQIQNYQSTVLQSLATEHAITTHYQGLQHLILCNYKNSLVAFNHFYEEFEHYSLIFKKMANKKGLKKQVLNELKNVCIKGELPQPQILQKVFIFPINTKQEQIISVLGIFYEAIYGVQCRLHNKCLSKEIKVENPAQQQQNVATEKTEKNRSKANEKKDITKNSEQKQNDKKQKTKKNKTKTKNKNKQKVKSSVKQQQNSQVQKPIISYQIIQQQQINNRQEDDNKQTIDNTNKQQQNLADIEQSKQQVKQQIVEQTKKDEQISSSSPALQVQPQSQIVNQVQRSTNQGQQTTQIKDKAEQEQPKQLAQPSQQQAQLSESNHSEAVVETSQSQQPQQAKQQGNAQSSNTQQQNPAQQATQTSQDIQQTLQTPKQQEVNENHQDQSSTNANTDNNIQANQQNTQNTQNGNQNDQVVQSNNNKANQIQNQGKQQPQLIQGKQNKQDQIVNQQA